MECKFCKLSSEYVHLATQNIYCDEECLRLHTTYREWKTERFVIQPTKELAKESFDEIILRTGGYPVNSSHRGGGFDFAPENTIHAFKKSVEHGARLLELDLRLTKDNHLVLLHWSTVDEVSDGSGPVSEFTLAELLKLDAAVRHPTLKGTGIQIATFKEFMDTFVPMNILFFFDFKDLLTLKMALRVIESYHIEGRFILGSVIGSVNDYILRYVESSSPRIMVCCDVTSAVRIMLAYYFGLLNAYTFDHEIIGFVLCRATLVFWSKALVDAIHQYGCRVVVSGYGEELNTPNRLKECIDFGVDFIMTDRPDLLQAILLKRERKKKKEKLSASVAEPEPKVMMMRGENGRRHYKKINK